MLFMWWPGQCGLCPSSPAPRERRALANVFCENAVGSSARSSRWKQMYCRAACAKSNTKRSWTRFAGHCLSPTRGVTCEVAPPRLRQLGVQSQQTTRLLNPWRKRRSFAPDFSPVHCADTQEGVEKTDASSKRNASHFLCEAEACNSTFADGVKPKTNAASALISEPCGNC